MTTESVETLRIPMNVHIAPTRQALGQIAAVDIAAALRQKLHHASEVRMIFAAAPSQSEMLQGLIRQPGIDWSRVTAFHMDEYLGLPNERPQRFGRWLCRAIFNHVPMKAVHLIEPGDEPERTCEEYAALLREAPIDFCLLGIGSNAHLAFNDPPANLNDPLMVRIVQLDLECRQQQVDDRCFDRIDDVPTHAITLSIPALLRAEQIYCCAPGKLKAEAARSMLYDPVSGASPATALRRHDKCIIYLDVDSAALLP